MSRIPTFALAALVAMAAAACETDQVEETPEAAEMPGEQPAAAPADQPVADGEGAAASRGPARSRCERT